MRHKYSQPPVFLDRDGTLIVERHYLADPAQVTLESGVIEGLRSLQANGHPLVVLSNQSGIARGLLSHSDASRVNERMMELLGQQGIEILGIYLCPHAPQARCGCRKPQPGLAIAAASDLGLTLLDCYVIGDKQSDLELADAIGGVGILMTTGHGAGYAGWASASGRPVFAQIALAADYIRSRQRAASSLVSIAELP